MPICADCGVEIEEGHEYCPLCGASLSEEARERRKEEGGDYSSALQRHEEKVGILFREIFGFIVLAAGLLVLAVDLSYGTEIGWSRYPLVSLAYVWFSIVIIASFKRRVFLLVASETGLSLLFLLLLDIFTEGRPWFAGLALPLTLLLSGLSSVTIVIIRRLKLSIFGGISASLIGAGLFTLCTEIVLRNFLHESIYVSWSLIPAAAAISIILFLFLFEKRLKKRGSDLDKYFHV